MKAWRLGMAAAVVAGGLGWVPPELWGDVVIVQKVEQGGKPPQSTQIVLKIKEGKLRADIGTEVSVIMDTASGETVTLRHSQKVALGISAKSARQLMEKTERLRRESGEISGEPPRIEPTGQRETILGREARAYAMQTGAVRITWWVAARQEGGDPMADAFDALQKTAMVQLAGGLTGIAPGADRLPGLPLKTEMVTPDGRKITTTLLSVKEQPLEAIDFVAPPEYRRLAEPYFGVSPILPTP